MMTEQSPGQAESVARPQPGDETTERGAIAWMVRNPVAANVLMLVMLVGGLIGLGQTKQEVIPDLALDMVTIALAYPGASPAEVEQGVVLAVEDQVAAIDGIKRVTSTSRQSMGEVKLELQLGEDPGRVLGDVKSAVDRITTFPNEAERPRVTLVSSALPVVSLLVYGEQSLSVLHDLAQEARRGLLAAGVSRVEIEGLPALEVSIEVPRARLQMYGLTLDDVASAVRQSSVDLPGGELETAGGELLLRVEARRRHGFEFENIVIRAATDGSTIRLGDIATIEDAYEDEDRSLYYDGKPALRLTVFREGSETPQEVAGVVREFQATFDAQLSGGVGVAVWSDDSEFFEDRISLLVGNASAGLVLVVIVLALFLDLRLAVWVSLGIPISFLASFMVLGTTDFSVNMVSLFAFIITLGMVVDDAIVVGESTYSKLERGVPARLASFQAAREMATPVTFAVLTTVAAFAPMFFIPGTMGKFFAMIPTVVVAVLVASLVESFFVLPAHLAHGHAKRKRRAGPLRRVRDRVDAALRAFVANIYRPVLRALIGGRYVVAAVAMAMFILTVGAIGSGRLPFNFFPTTEGDMVTATVTYPYGTDIEITRRAQVELEAAGQRAVADNGGRDALLRGAFTRLGEGAPSREPNPPPPPTGSHVVSVELMLTPSDARDVGAEALASAWEEQMPELPGVESVTFNAAGGPTPGAAVHVQLIHPDQNVLAEASNEIAAWLHEDSSLRNVRNSYSAGKQQLAFHLRPQADALGLTADQIARQVRAAFFGVEALREQRGRNELRVRARLPESERRSEFDLEQLQIRTRTGAYVPLTRVAEVQRSRAPTAVYHEGAARMVEVKAELAHGVASSREALASLQEDVLPRLRNDHAQLQIAMGGEQREQKEVMTALGSGYAFALVAIYGLLAIPFRSYVQPLIVMSVIPLGLTGAALGHWVMGYPLSLMSVMGFVALSGVVVNGAIVLIDATNGFLRSGASTTEAVIEGGAARLRPIMLTSLTTFLGLAPMMAEQSMQARFLIPMAISLGFGVLFTTFVVLLVIPCLYAIVADARSLLFRSATLPRSGDEP